MSNPDTDKIAIALAAKKLLGNLKKYDNSVVQTSNSLSKNSADISLNKVHQNIINNPEFNKPPIPYEEIPTAIPVDEKSITDEGVLDVYQDDSNFSKESEENVQLELFNNLNTLNPELTKIYDEIYSIKKKLADINSKLNILVSKKEKQKKAYENRKRKTSNTTKDSSGSI